MECLEIDHFGRQSRSVALRAVRRAFNQEEKSNEERPRSGDGQKEDDAEERVGSVKQGVVIMGREVVERVVHLD